MSVSNHNFIGDGSKGQVRRAFGGVVAPLQRDPNFQEDLTLAQAEGGRLNDKRRGAPPIERRSGFVADTLRAHPVEAVAIGLIVLCGGFRLVHDAISPNPAEIPSVVVTDVSSTPPIQLPPTPGASAAEQQH